MNILLIALGGAFGSVARYFLASVVGARMGSEFPYGTLAVNVLGSFIMGLLIGWLARHTPERANDIRLFLAVGVLGGFTTFSAFSLDAITLMERGEFTSMAIYIFASVLLSLIGLMGGLQLLRMFA